MFRGCRPSLRTVALSGSPVGGSWLASWNRMSAARVTASSLTARLLRGERAEALEALLDHLNGARLELPRIGRRSRGRAGALVGGRLDGRGRLDADGARSLWRRRGRRIRSALRSHGRRGHDARGLKADRFDRGGPVVPARRPDETTPSTAPQNDARPLHDVVVTSFSPPCRKPKGRRPPDKRWSGGAVPGRFERD